MSQLIEEVKEEEVAEVHLFKACPGASPPHWSDPQNKELLQKWNIAQRSRLIKFRFNCSYDAKHPQSFFLDLFNSDDFKCQFSMNHNVGNKSVPVERVTKVDAQRISATATSTAVFDCLEQNEISYPSGELRKCIPSRCKGVPVDDKLRKAILDEESEFFGLIPDETRDEFIFKLFSHLVVGGPLCQFEDKLTPYVDCVRGLYKDLLKVKRNKNTGAIEVVSHVYLIRGVSAPCSAPVISRGKKAPQTDSDTDSSSDDDDEFKYFETPSPFNLSFVAIDPGSQIAWFYYFARGKGWS